MGKRKDSVSLNARIGSELFGLLERYCLVTGQPKTVAVERALRAYCTDADPAASGPMEEPPDER